MQYAVYPFFPHSDKGNYLAGFSVYAGICAVVATRQRHGGEVMVTMQIDLVAEGRNGYLMSS